jgi:hypothetical protein
MPDMSGMHETSAFILAACYILWPRKQSCFVALLNVRTTPVKQLPATNPNANPNLVV